MIVIFGRPDAMLKSRTACLWLGLAIVPRACFCGPDLAETVPIPNSSWVVSTEIYSCSAADSGGLEVFATDVASKQRIDLLVLNGEEDTHVEYLGDNHIQISLPNLVDIRLQVFSFGSYQVTYKFIPSDDPQARANYQKWVANPKDPVANKWYEDNIVSKMHSGVPHAPESRVPRSRD